MGEIRLECEVSNVRNGRKHGSAGKRRVIDALVDTGAAGVLLPVDLVKGLGIPIGGKQTVTLADDRQIQMPLAGPIWLTALGREMVTDCFVGPKGCEPLVGQIVLERLDLILDPRKQTVKPRLISGPVLKLKWNFSHRIH